MGLAIRIYLVWLPAAIFSLHSKWVLLKAEGFRIWSRLAGLLDPSHLAAWDRLGFFVLDLFIGFLLIPALLILATRYFSRSFRLCVAAMAASSALILQYVQIRAFLSVGNFLSAGLFGSALQRAMESPEDILRYDSPGSLVKLSALLAMMALLAIVPGLAVPEAIRRIASGMAFRRAACAAALVACVPAASLSLGSPRGGYYHRSFLAESLIQFAFAGEERVAGPVRPISEVRAEFLDFTATAEARRDEGYWGKARGYNVLYFVLESAPSACLPPEEEWEEYPELARLRPTSLIASAHHSTYPYTNRALFSLFASMYPSTRTAGFLPIRPGVELPGVVRTLRGMGYATAAYFPIRQTFESDETLFAALGFEAQRYPSGRDAGAPRAIGWRKLLARDEASLEYLLRDIAARGRSGTPFVAAFLPQIGHGPWEDVTGGNVQDTLRRGRALIRLQDRMLGRLLTALSESGQRGRTLVVVTGDHGLRTRKEFPSLPGGTADSISFHVPFLLNAPGVLASTLDIPWLTSHVDVGPTLLDLLGVAEGRELEQGLALWDERIRGRTTFFLGKHYFGADAFHEAGAFSMWSHPGGTAYRGGAIHFPLTAALPAASPRSGEIRDRVLRMAALQEAYLKNALIPLSGTGGKMAIRPAGSGGSGSPRPVLH